MTMQSGESSHPLLSCTDGIAASTTDLLLLLGRVSARTQSAPNLFGQT